MTRGIGTALGVALTSALYIVASGAADGGVWVSAGASGLTTSLATLGASALVVGARLVFEPRLPALAGRAAAQSRRR